MSRRNLRRGAFNVPSGCVVSAPELGLSPGGFPPAPVVLGVGTFLSGVPLPESATVSCPLPPGPRPKAETRIASRTPGAIYPGVRWSGTVPGERSDPREGRPRQRAGLTISRGRVVASDGAEYLPVRGSDGRFRDILDVADALTPGYDGLYVVDLDGRRKGEPQLDYIQELSRDADLWLDAGVRVADEAIDGLVAGARRVILSTASLASARELRRAWRMSPEVVVEIAVGPDRQVVALEEGWGGSAPATVAAEIRKVGVETILYSPRAHLPDWSLVVELARFGPTWVGGSYAPGDLPSLSSSSAAGGVYFVPADILSDLPAPTPRGGAPT